MMDTLVEKQTDDETEAGLILRVFGAYMLWFQIPCIMMV